MCLLAAVSSQKSVNATGSFDCWAYCTAQLLRRCSQMVDDQPISLNPHPYQALSGVQGDRFSRCIDARSSIFDIQNNGRTPALVVHPNFRTRDVDTPVGEILEDLRKVVPNGSSANVTAAKACEHGVSAKGLNSTFERMAWSVLCFRLGGAA
jgi:hypothetical protein